MSDRLLRTGTAAAVLLVAFIAAVISYQHLYSLALSHGEPRLDSLLIPLAIDGTVITASLLMLRAARAGRRTPWLARLMLVVSVAMTVAANVAFGWHFAAWGVLMAGFPAAAFLGNAEATIMYGRQAGTAHENARAGEAAPGLPALVPSDSVAVPGVPAALNGHAHAAAELFAADIEAGRVPGIRTIRSGLHVGQDNAQQVQTYLRTLTRTR